MISTVLWALCGVVLVFLVYIGVREILNKLRLSRYETQGFATIYEPFIGEIKPVLDGQKSLDENKPFENLAVLHKGKPGLVFNHSSGKKSWIHLLDIDLIREYLSFENEVSYRLPMIDIKVDLGFIMKGGDDALAQRTVFSSIFSQNNLTRIAPQLRNIVDKHFSSGNLSCSSQGTQVGDYANSNLFLEGLMKEFSRDLIYHDSLPLPISKTGRSPAEELVEIFDIVMGSGAGLHPLNLILEGWPHQLNLLPGSRQALARANDLAKNIKDFIQKREAAILSAGIEKYDSSKFNIIDAMILHNQESRKAGNLKDVLSLDQMAGNCNLFTFASFDTTLTTANSMFFNLGQDRALQDRLWSEIKHAGLQDGIKSMDNIDDCPLLTDVILESLRIFPPGPMSFDRMIFKDFKLGKYQFFKGDLINVALGANMWDKEKFSSGRSFKVGSRQASNKKNFLPFLSGRRGCIGQVLAELELKQLLIYVVSKYILQPVSKPEEVRYYFNFAMKLDNCFVKLVPRA